MPTTLPMRRTCGTMEVHEDLVAKDPVYVENRLRIESFSARVFETAGRAAAFAAIDPIVIPVVVHLVHTGSDDLPTQAQVESQIVALNRDFRKLNADLLNAPAPFRRLAADCRIEFVLARRDPGGQPTDGITRTPTTKDHFTSNANDIKFASSGGHDAWSRDEYLNVWVGPDIRDHTGRALLGYAQFPGGPAETDGVVIVHKAFGETGTAEPPFDRGRTAVHEVGHWLNLLHIWGDDGHGCGGSDNVTDTPNQAGPNVGPAPAFPHVTCGNGPNGDMYVNYMDYVNDDDMCMFTAGQVARMHAALAGPRAALVHSSAGTAPGATPDTVLPDIAASPVATMMVRAGPRPDRIFNGVEWVAVPDHVLPW